MEDTKFINWFSRIFRWSIGLAFITAGIMFFDVGGWTAIAFGLLIFVTGFLKPRRCIDNSCFITEQQHKQDDPK